MHESESVEVNAKALVEVLRELSDNKPLTISNSTLSRLMNLSFRALFNALDYAEEHKWIKRTTGYQKGVRGLARTITVTGMFYD